MSKYTTDLSICYEFNHIGNGIRMSSLRDRLCFGDKMGPEEHVGYLSHIVKLVAKEKSNLRLRASI